MPTTPWSQPWVACPAPRGNVNGWPRSHDASNCWPSRKRTPTYCTVTVSPGFAVAPVPLTMSCLTRTLGGLPGWRGMRGFLARSLSGVGMTVVAGALLCVCVVACVCVCVAGVCVAGDDAAVAFLFEPPQPATARAPATAATRTHRDM